MMQRITASSRKFAYLYVAPHRPLVGSIVLIAHVREAEFFSGKNRFDLMRYSFKIPLDGRCLVEAVLTAPRHEILEIYGNSFR